MSQPLDLNQLAQKIKQWGAELGFQKVGITDTDLSASEPKLQAWLDKQYHGEMEWMARHGMMRARPHELLPGTLRVISVRMNYLPANAAFARTQALLRALPEFAQDKARLASLPGVVPGKYDRPVGCLLNPRCPYATDKCRAEEPELNLLEGGRQSKCHYPLDDAGRPGL